MLRTITPIEMKRIETAAMKAGRVTGEALMTRAAAHVARAAAGYLHEKKGRVLAICGRGNNGGDGIATLRLLLLEHPQAGASLWLMEGVLSPDCQRELDRLLGECPGVQVVRVSQEGLSAAAGEALALPLPLDIACIVDALFGTGLCREVTGAAAALCGLMNQAKADGIPVISVDIPSGLHGETGEILGIAVQATETVTFHRPKPGLWLGLGPNHTGKVKVADIGLLPEWDDAEGFQVLEPADLPRLLPPRQPVSHKGSYGRVLLIMGSRGMAGAAAISALACLRTGAGLLTLACPEAIADTLQQLCPCAMCLPLPENPQEALALLRPTLSRADAIGMGCGLGTDAYAKTLVQATAEHLAKENTPAVLDADALNLLAATKGTSPRFTSRQILTPHPAEAARLLGCATEDIVQGAPRAARLLAAQTGGSVVLKGTTSVLISGPKEGLSILGTPALAKGGSGDVLTGVLAALAANAACGALSLSDFEIMQVGCALLGLAGRAAEKVYGGRGVLATDVCGFLGKGFFSEINT